MKGDGVVVYDHAKQTNKQTNKQTRQIKYPAILTKQAWLIKDYLHGTCFGFGESFPA